MKQNIVKDKSYDFAVHLIPFVKGLPRDVAGMTLGRQLIRSGTSIGANIEEAIAGFSREDFLYKMNIALKEARETSRALPAESRLNGEMLRP